MRSYVIAGTGQVLVGQIIKELGEGHRLLGYLDDNSLNSSRNLYGSEILGGFDWLRAVTDEVYVINAIARTCKLREESTKKLQSLGAKFTNLIDRSASYSDINMGNGNVIGKNVVIEPGATIGNHNMILSGCHIGHDVVIGDYCFIGVGCIMQGFSKVESRSFLSANVVVEPESQVSEGCVIGSGCIIHGTMDRGMMALSSLPRQIKVSKLSAHYRAS